MSHYIHRYVHVCSKHTCVYIYMQYIMGLWCLVIIKKTPLEIGHLWLYNLILTAIGKIKLANLSFPHLWNNSICIYSIVLWRLHWLSTASVPHMGYSRNISYSFHIVFFLSLLLLVTFSKWLLVYLRKHVLRKDLSQTFTVSRTETFLWHLLTAL